MDNDYNFWDEGTFEMAVEHYAIDHECTKQEARDILLEVSEGKT